MPVGKRSLLLYIHKRHHRVHLRDLRHPGCAIQRQRLYLVANDLPFEHRLTSVFAQYLKMQMGRGDAVQLEVTGEKRPCFPECYSGQQLLTRIGMDLHACRTTGGRNCSTHLLSLPSCYGTPPAHRHLLPGSRASFVPRPVAHHSILPGWWGYVPGKRWILGYLFLQGPSACYRSR